MRIETIQQFAIVRGETAAEFTEMLNEKMLELRGKGPKVEFDGLTAYIKYSETIRHPESLAEEYEAVGARFCCEQCPAFEPKTKIGGGADRRCKKGGCPNTTYGKTFSDSAACDLLYQMLTEGKVKLCFTE